MKKHLILILLMINAVPLLSQQVASISESAPIREIEDGWVKLVLLENGNTAFIHFTQNKGFKVVLYNQGHKLVSENIIKPSYDGGSRMGMYGIIESVLCLKGNIVIFVSTMKMVTSLKAQPILHRLIVDGNKGTLLKEEEIGRMNTFAYKEEVAMKRGFLARPGFFIKKDPNSDNYAVAFLDTFESDQNKRLKFFHYGTDHKILSEAYFHSPDNNYKFLWYLDMTVVGDTKIIAMVRCRPQESAGTNTVVYAGALNRSANRFDQKQVEFIANGGPSFGVFEHNETNNTLTYFGMIGLGDYAYSYEIIRLDPATLEKINRSHIERLDGCPERIVMNKDGSYAIVSQKITSFSQYSSSGRNHERITHYLGSFTVRHLNNKLELIAKYDVPQSYTIYGGQLTNPAMPLLSPDGPETINRENEFKTCALLYDGDKPKLLVNELARNINQKKTKEILGLSEIDTYLVTTNSNDPKEQSFQQIFPSANPKEHSFAMLGASVFDASNNTLITIRRSNKKGWQNQVVWIKLKD